MGRGIKSRWALAAALSLGGWAIHAEASVLLSEIMYDPQNGAANRENVIPEPMTVMLCAAALLAA